MARLDHLAAVKGLAQLGATLGELIVALTDEVMPFVRDPASLHLVVSYILNDVLGTLEN